MAVSRWIDSNPKSIHIPPTMINATPTQLRKAADIQEKIQSLQEELESTPGRRGIHSCPTTEAPKKRKKFSAAGRARMRAAQKARWAKIKGTAPSAKPAKKAKRKMSAKDLPTFELGLQRGWLHRGKLHPSLRRLRRSFLLLPKPLYLLRLKRDGPRRRAGKNDAVIWRF